MSDYGALARQRWPKADIYGIGRWAVPSCGGKTEVSLLSPKDSALRLKAMLDRDGCGRQCRGAHEIIDMDEGKEAVGTTPEAH